VQLTNARWQKPVFRFGTTPFTSTEMNLRKHYREMYAHMTSYMCADVTEGVRAIKDGYTMMMMCPCVCGVTSLLLCLFLPVLNHPLPLELFVYLHLIIGILSLRTFAHLTVLSLSNPALNLTFSLLPITSSHPHASASDSTFDYWRYINI